MKRICITIMSVFIALSISAQQKNTEISNELRAKTIEVVKKYCKELSLFSRDINNIDKLDSIINMSENSKVQTFDDLSDYATKDVEYRSQPLFQYLQNITAKYDNSLKVTFSDFKFEKAITEPATLPMIPANTYALVSVNKKIKGKGINRTIPLGITVNTTSMKIGGTVSSDYEDPQSIYLKAIECFQNVDIENGIENLKRCINFKTFGGRYRAMSDLAIRYILRGNNEEGLKLLTEAAENDPMGEVRLGLVYIEKKFFPSLHNLDKGIEIFSKYADISDKDVPHRFGKDVQNIPMYANLGLANYYLCIARNFDLAEKYALRALEYCDKYLQWDTDSKIMASVFYAVTLACKGKIDESKEHCTKYVSEEGIDKMKNTLSREGTQEIYSSVMSYIAYNNFQKGNLTAMEEYIEKAKKYNIPNTYNLIGIIYMEAQRYDEAFECFNIAGLQGIEGAAYRMSEYYMPTEMRGGNPNDPYEAYLMKQTGKSYDEWYKWAKIAADGGNMNSCGMVVMANMQDNIKIEKSSTDLARYGCMYSNGLPLNAAHLTLVNNFITNKLQQNDAALVSTLQELAEAGDPSANFFMYEKAYDIDKDSIQGAKYLFKSVEQGSPFGRYTLSDNYLCGRCVKADTAMAVAVIKPLVDVNVPRAICMMGIIEYCKKNYDAAIQAFQKACELGDGDAAVKLAQTYDEGLAVTRDPKTVKMYYEKAMELYNATGYFWMAGDMKEAIAKIEAEINEGAAFDYITSSLTELSDNTLAPEKRIDLAETVLQSLFASPKAIVRTVGSNGKTVVATDTAKDFLLRLSTVSKKQSFECLDVKKDGKGKITELKLKQR